MLIVAFKLIASPCLIGAVSLAGRRWGPAVSGWLIGLPLTSAPVLFFLTLEHGTASAATAAQGIMLGGVAVAAFCFAFAWADFYLRWWATVLVALGAYLLAAWAMHMLVLPVTAGAVLVLIALALALWRFPPLREHISPTTPPRWDLPLRMLLATAIIVTLTSVVPLLGPRLVGLLSVFPAFVLILGTFALRQQGATASAAVMRGVLLGLFGFVAFYLIVGLTVVSWGIGAAFLTATIATLAVQGATLALTK